MHQAAGAGHGPGFGVEQLARRQQADQLVTAAQVATAAAFYQPVGSTVAVDRFGHRAGKAIQYVVLKVTSRRSQGDIRYEDVKDRIRQQLGQELAIRRYIDQLRKSPYVEIRS